jgi:hypothetical protein
MEQSDYDLLILWVVGLSLDYTVYERFPILDEPRPVLRGRAAAEHLHLLKSRRRSVRRWLRRLSKGLIAPEKVNFP